MRYQTLNYDNDEPIRPDWPFLTTDIEGIGGQIKTVPEDFFVEEIPLYAASGEGTHIYAFIEKRNMTTAIAIDELAKYLGVRRLDIGYAGRKDARAVTRQWVSIEHVEPDKVAAFKTKSLRVLEVRRHVNKLKIGHLAGNRFIIKIRNMTVPLETAAQRAKEILDILTVRGVPNYFGPQRFGYRLDSHLLGHAAIKGDVERFYDLLLGTPQLDTDPTLIKARQLYCQGDYKAAYDTWPGIFRDHKNALKDIMKDGDKQRAFNEFDPHLMKLFVASWQSELFNRVLAARMPHIDKVFVGDMAYKHDNGACFRVEDAAAEQPRCDRFEISPTGPLLGHRMTELTDQAAQFEAPIIQAIQLNEQDLERLHKSGGRGGRRPLRFRPKNIDIQTGSDQHGPYLQLSFELPSGCYATTMLRELTKT